MIPISPRLPAILRGTAAGLARTARRLIHDVRGGTMIWTVISFPVVFGMTGLGLDTSIWYLDRRVMQSAVDTGSISGALTKAAGGDQAAIAAAIAKSFADNKFTLKGSDVLTVNSPPTSGANVGNASAVEVILRRNGAMLLSQFMTNSGITIGTRAVSGDVVVGKHCIVALDPTMDSAVEFTGEANAEILCGIAANSNSAMAIHVGGEAHLTADPIQAVGDIFVEGAAVLDSVHPPQPHSPAVPDPYLSLQMPETDICSAMPSVEGPAGSEFTLSPGHYCGNLIIENKIVDFEPGTYIIEDGDLKFKAGSVITGDGVTFILMGSNPALVGTFLITSETLIDLSAPSTGDYAGVLFYVQPDAHTNDGNGNPFKNKIEGDPDTILKGALYTRSREIRFAGGSTIGGQCMSLVARKITITGNAVIANDPTACAAVGLNPIQLTRIRLLE